MKKLYSLSLIPFLAIAASAQTNLVANGNFEAWTDGAPEGYTITIPNNGGSIIEETTDVQEGNSSAAFTAPAGTGNVRAAVTDIPVTAGNTYVFSYWMKDESDNAKSRHWAYWRSDSENLNDNADILRPDYIVNTDGWQQVSHTMVAPEGATFFRLDFRVYQEASGADSGIIYYDNVMFYDQATNGLNQNNIAGLKVYPNPLTGNTLNITSDNNADKTVVIYDVLGKQVLTAQVTNGTVNAAALTTGVYIVKITEEGKTATKKLVVR
jgi:hypothetical protein